MELARLVGLPVEVVERARSLLATLERGELLSENERGTSGQATVGTQFGLLAPRPSPIEADLRSIDVMPMTPVEAQNEVHALAAAARRGDEPGRDEKN